MFRRDGLVFKPLAAFPEDPCSVPRTHIRQFMNIYNLSARRSKLPSSVGTSTHMPTHMPTHTSTHS